jgi:hypothetical protein
LRVKGILNLQSESSPVIIHGVHHVFHPPVQLPAWPDLDRRSKIVHPRSGAAYDRGQLGSLQLLSPCSVTAPLLRSIATDSFGAPLVPADCGSGSDRRHREHDQAQNARCGPMRAHGFILARRDLDRESRRESSAGGGAGAARLRLPKTVAEGPAPRKPRARPGPPPRASSASSTAGPAAVRSG